MSLTLHPKIKNNTTARFNRRAVVLISILLSLWVTVFVLFVLTTMHNRDDLISYVPDDAALYIHLKPNQQQYKNLNEIIDDFPLIEGSGLTYFDINKAMINEVGIVVLNDFQKLVLINLKKDVSTELILDIETLGLATKQLTDNILMVSDGFSSIQYHRSPKIDWTNISTKTFGSIHMNGLPIGRFKINDTQINLDLMSKGTEHKLSLEYIPNETIVYLSATDLDTNLFVQPILDKVFTNGQHGDIKTLFSDDDNSPTELLFLAKNKEIFYLISGGYNNNQDEIIQYLGSVISSQETDYTNMLLPDYTNIQEIVASEKHFSFEFFPINDELGFFSYKLGENEINYLVGGDQLYISNSKELLLNYINPVAHIDSWQPIDSNAVAVLFPQRLADFLYKPEGVNQNSVLQSFINIDMVQFFHSNIMFSY